VRSEKCEGAEGHEFDAVARLAVNIAGALRCVAAEEHGDDKAEAESLFLSPPSLP